MPSLSQSLDLARALCLARTSAALNRVDPRDVAGTWPTASAAVLASLMASQETAATAVADDMAAQLARVVGFDPGMDWAPVARTAMRPPADLAADLAVTPKAAAARRAAGMAPQDALAPSLAHVRGLAGSLAHETARQATAAVTASSPAWEGWRWVPEAGACAWCRMQATRGAVFGADTVHRKGSADHSHANCKCEGRAVTDEVSARRIRNAGQAEWERMLHEWDVPAKTREMLEADLRAMSPQMRASVMDSLSPSARRYARELGDAPAGSPPPARKPRGPRRPPERMHAKAVSRAKPGDLTPERLVQVRAQVDITSGVAASNPKVRAVMDQRLVSLRQEEQAILAALARDAAAAA